MLRQIILDTETTGLDPIKGHRIVEIGCLEMVNRRLTGKSFHTYLNPEREIDPGAVQVSGLTLEFLQDKPKFKAVVEDFITFINSSELIIHNAPFDLSFITEELRRLKHPWQCKEPNVQIFDTLALARRLHPGQKNNLDALCRRYNVDNSHRTYHGALLDSEILSKLYLLMTAGQGSLSLEQEGEGDGESGGGNSSQVTALKAERKQKVKRKDFPLRVISASEEELKIHLDRLQRLKEAKN